MASRVNRSEIWLYSFGIPDKRRPVLVLSRQMAISLLRTKLQERHIAVQTLLMFSDDIARAILNTALEREVTVIVLGLTGKNVFARLLAGNVPVELIKNTKIPVLLLPPDFAGSI